MIPSLRGNNRALFVISFQFSCLLVMALTGRESATRIMVYSTYLRIGPLGSLMTSQRRWADVLRAASGRFFFALGR